MVKRAVTPDVLLVCRANRARSPIARALLAHYAVEHELVPMPVITSSGLYAQKGQPLLTSMGDAVRRKGYEVSEHRSRVFSLRDASAARIVITFEQELTRNILAQGPTLVRHTFTLREIVRLSASPDWDAAWNGLPDVAARLHALRPLVEPGDDDTPDPVGGRRRVARSVFDGLERDVEIVAPVVLGPHQSGALDAP